jgi:hypothetical protein
MIFRGFLADHDLDRAERTFRKLAGHDISGWALTGGFATELHIAQRGTSQSIRTLRDIDFIVDSFDCIPESLGGDFLLRHVHPLDPPGKTLLQCVDPETKVRVDVFRAYGSVMERVSPADRSTGFPSIISLQDLTARTARLIWDLSANVPIAPKYAKDFLRLLAIVKTDAVEVAWKEHKKPHAPKSFSDAAIELRRLIESRPDLLVTPAHSLDVKALCERCRGTEVLPLADPEQIVSLLGYC